MKKVHLLVILLFLAACGGQTDKKTQLEKLQEEQRKLDAQITTLQGELGITADTLSKPAPKSVAVAVQPVKTENFSHFLEIQGKVDAMDNIAVSPKQPGIVTQVLVVRGQQVQKGDLLATLDDAIFQQSLQEIYTNLDFAKTILSKQEGLWAQKIGTEVQYLQAKNTVDNLQKKLATLQEQADLYKVKAPISGVVDEVNTKVGEGIAVGSPSFRIINLNNMRILADIPEAYYKDIKTGSGVEIYFPDLDKAANSTIKAKSNIINPINRTFNVEIKLPNSTGARPNMLATVKLKDYGSNSVVIPVNTVQSSEDGSYVFVAEKTAAGDYVARRRNIVTGMTYGTGTEVKSGLQAGDMLITVGYQDVSNGQSIKF